MGAVVDQMLKRNHYRQRTCWCFLVALALWTTTQLVFPGTKLLLLGVFSTAERWERRSLIRMTYAADLSPKITLRFAICLHGTYDTSIQTLLQVEQRTHNDLLLLNCTENMDEGKTYTFFKSLPKAFSTKKHSFVMKADDDAYIHTPNLLKKLSTFPSNGVYFGRAAGQFMAGMGYILSWDLVQWIASDPFPETHQCGQEDALLAWWLVFSRRVSHWENDSSEAFYDAPESKKDWAHSYSQNTLLIHQLKNTSWFLSAAAHFMRPVPMKALL